MINSKEFARRRKQLMRMMGPKSAAILPAAEQRLRNRDVEYPYRPDSDFHYLSGFAEPEAVLVLMPGRKPAEYIVFCRDRDPDMELWHGRRAGPAGLVADFGAGDAFPISDIDDIMPGLLEGCERLYYTIGVAPEFDQRVFHWLNVIRSQARSGRRAPAEFVSLEPWLHDMRLFKSRAEQGLMRKAAKIAGQAHQRAMRFCRPGRFEYEIEAEILHEFQRHGATAAYPSIVGGGANACILHYTENRDVLQDGDLLLIDAGAELDCYASDITRTFPVNGRFSAPQRAIYDLVLDAQRAAIEQVQPGKHWNEPHEAAVRVLTKGLVRLGLLKGKTRQLIKDGEYRRFYMHRTGHWLGMDVHDVGDYKLDDQWRVFEPGMVLTVEPGLYIAAGSKGVPKKWWNIGVRIEDDVLVSAQGPVVLSAAVPKHADDIEALMAAQ